jgi:hypothetical protein
MVRDLKIIKFSSDALSTEPLIAIIQLENFICDQKILDGTQHLAAGLLVNFVLYF